MTKDEIRKIIEESKKTITQDQQDFTETLKEDLLSFKKKILDRI